MDEGSNDDENDDENDDDDESEDEWEDVEGMNCVIINFKEQIDTWFFFLICNLIFLSHFSFGFR